jgi:hypothetical protein
MTYQNIFKGGAKAGQTYGGEADQPTKAWQWREDAMQPSGFDKVLNPIFFLSQPIWRTWRALKEEDVDLFSQQGLLDPALLPLAGVFFDHENDVMPDYMASEMFGEEHADKFWHQFGAAVLTDPMSFMAAPLTGVAKGAKAAQLAFTGGARLATKAAVKAAGKRGIKKSAVAAVDDTTSVFHRAANFGTENFDSVIKPQAGLRSTDDILQGSTLRQLQGSIDHGLSNGRFLDPSGVQLGANLTKAELKSLKGLQESLIPVTDDFLDKPLQSLVNQSNKRKMALGLPIFGDFTRMHTLAPEWLQKHGGWMNWWKATALATYTKPAKITMRAIDPILAVVPPLHKTSLATQKAITDFAHGYSKGALANVTATYLKNGEVNALSADDFLRLENPLAERVANSAHVNLKTRGTVSLADHRVSIQEHAEILTSQLMKEAEELGLPFDTVVARRFGGEALDFLRVTKAADAPQVFKAELTDLLQKREWRSLELPGYTLELDTSRAAITSRAYQNGRALKQFKTKLFQNDQGIEGAEAFRTFWNTLESSSSQQTELLGMRMFTKMRQLADVSGEEIELLNQLTSSVLALKIDRRELMSFFNFLDRPDMPLDLWHKEFQQFFGGRMNAEVNFLKGVVSQNIADIPKLQGLLDSLSVPIVRVPEEVLKGAPANELSALHKMNRGIPVDSAMQARLMEKYNLTETKGLYTEAYTPGLDIPNIGLVDPKNPGEGVISIIQTNLPAPSLKLSSGGLNVREVPLASLDKKQVKEYIEELKGTKRKIESAVDDGTDMTYAQKESIQIINADLNALKNMRAHIDSAAEYRPVHAEVLDLGKLKPTYEKKVNYIAKSDDGVELGLEDVAKAFGDEVSDLDDLASVYSRLQFRQAALNHYVKLQGSGGLLYGMSRDIPESFIQGFMDDVDALGGMLKQAIIKPLSVGKDGGTHTVAEELFDVLDEVRNITLNAMNDNNLAGAYALPLGYLQRATSGKEFKAIQLALGDTVDAVPGLRGTVSARLANTRLNRSYTLQDLNDLATDLARVENAHPSVQPVMRLIEDQRTVLQAAFKDPARVQAYTVDPIASILAHVSEVQEAIGQRKWHEFIKANGGKHGITSLRVTDVVLHAPKKFEPSTTGTASVLERRIVDDVGDYQYPGAKVRFVDDVGDGTLGRASVDGSDILVSKDNTLLKKTLDWIQEVNAGVVGKLSTQYADGSRATFPPGLQHALKTTEDLQDFVLGHELAHSIIKQQVGETQGSWETRVTNFAMEQMGIERGANTAAVKVLQGIRVKPGQKVLFDTLMPENFWVGDGHYFIEGSTEARQVIKDLYGANHINESGVLMMREAFRANPLAFKQAEGMMAKTSATLNQMSGSGPVALEGVQKAQYFMGALAGATIKNMSSAGEMNIARNLLIDDLGEAGFVEWAMKNFKVEGDIAKAAMRNQDDFLAIVASSALTKVGTQALEKAGLGSFVKEFTTYFRQLLNRIVKTFTDGGSQAGSLDPAAYSKLAEQLEGMVTGALQVHKDSAAVALSTKARQGVAEFVAGAYSNGLSTVVKKRLEELGLSEGLEAYAGKTLATRRQLTKQSLDLARVAANLGPEGQALLRRVLDADISLPTVDLHEANVLAGLTKPTRWSIVDDVESNMDALQDLIARQGGRAGMQDMIEFAENLTATSRHGDDILRGSLDMLQEDVAKATGRTFSHAELRELATTTPAARKDVVIAGGVSPEEMDVINDLMLRKGEGAFRLRTQSAAELGIGPVAAKGVSSQLDFLLDKGVTGLPSSVDVERQMRVFDAMLDSEKSAFNIAVGTFEASRAKVASLFNKTTQPKTILPGMSAAEVKKIKAYNASLPRPLDQATIDTTEFTWVPPVMSPGAAEGMDPGYWAVVSPSIGAPVKNTRVPITQRTGTNPVMKWVTDPDTGKKIRIKVDEEIIMTKGDPALAAKLQPEIDEVNKIWNSINDAASERASYIKSLEEKVETARVAYTDKVVGDYVKQIRSQLDDQVDVTSKLMKMLEGDGAAASRADMHSFLAKAKLSTVDLQRLSNQVGMRLSPAEATAMQKKMYAFLGDAQDELMDAVPGGRAKPSGPSTVKRVISGGQTGADRQGIEWAKGAGLETGGVAPKRFYTEVGDDITLRDDFGLTEIDDATTAAYKGREKKFGPRTEQNILQSDVTIIFGDASSAGSRLTKNLADQHGKPIIVNPTGAELREFVARHGAESVNIAGNRAAKLKKRYPQGINAVLEEGLGAKAASGPMKQGTLFDLGTEMSATEAKLLDALVNDADTLRTYIKQGNLTKELDSPTKRILESMLSERITNLSGVVHAAKAAKKGFTKAKILKSFLGGSEQQTLEQGRKILRELEKNSTAGLELMGAHGGVPTSKVVKKLASEMNKKNVIPESTRAKFQSAVDEASMKAQSDFVRRIEGNPDIPTEDALRMAKELSGDVPKQAVNEYSMVDNGWRMPEEYAYLKGNQGRRLAGDAFDIPQGMRPGGGDDVRTTFSTAPESRATHTAPFHLVGEVDGKRVTIPGEYFTQAKLNISSVGHGEDLGAAIRNKQKGGQKMSLSGEEVTPEALAAYRGHQVTIGPEGFNNALQQQMKLDVPSNWAAGVKFYDQLHTISKLMATSMRIPGDFHTMQVINSIPQGILEEVGPVAMIQGWMATARVMTKDAYDVMGLDNLSALMQSGKINPAARGSKYPKVIGGTIHEMISIGQGRAGRLDLGEIVVEHEDMLFRTGDNAFTYDDIIKSLIQEGALDTMVRKDMVRLMNADEQIKFMREKFLGEGSTTRKGVRDTWEAGLAVAEASELFVRLSMMHGALISGMDLRSAARSVANAMVNYGDITTWEKQWAKRLAFFYTFPRKMLPKAGAHMMQSPGKGASLVNHLLQTSDEHVGTSEGRPEIAIGDYRVNLGRMAPQVDAITALASIADTLMPALGGLLPDDGFLKGDSHPRRLTGEGAPDKPLGPSMIGGVMGWSELFPTEDPLATRSDWLEELTRSNWAIKMVMGDPLLGSKDPKVEYSALEKAAKMVLPFRKVRPYQEEQMAASRIKSHLRRYKRELEQAEAAGEIKVAELLTANIKVMEDRVKEINKLVAAEERKAKGEEYMRNRRR